MFSASAAASGPAHAGMGPPHLRTRQQRAPTTRQHMSRICRTPFLLGATCLPLHKWHQPTCRPLH